MNIDGGACNSGMTLSLGGLRRLTVGLNGLAASVERREKKVLKNIVFLGSTQVCISISYLIKIIFVLCINWPEVLKFLLMLCSHCIY